MSDVAQAAEWMLDLFERQRGELLQADAVSGLEEKFGECFIRYNANGNTAIAPEVLRAFRKLTEDRVVWSSTGRYWRYRESYDNDGRSTG